MALGTLNFRALCRENGISTKTGYKWRERFLRQGLEGMEEDSRQPRGSPKQLSEEQVCEMVKLKLVHRHWGRASVLLRRGVPVPGILATHRPISLVAILLFCCRYQFADDKIKP